MSTICQYGLSWPTDTLPITVVIGEYLESLGYVIGKHGQYQAANSMTLFCFDDIVHPTLFPCAMVSCFETYVQLLHHNMRSTCLEYSDPDFLDRLRNTLIPN